MPFAHPDGAYAITALYSVPDDAWYLELDRVGEQRNLVTAIVPDEEPPREPTVGDIGSQPLGMNPRAQRAGDVVLTRPVFGRPNDWATTVYDCIPADEWHVR